MSENDNAINARRTFAIISHPDAGKTTITEKLLLLGSAIQVAGSVKGKRGPHATSDWMTMEQGAGYFGDIIGDAIPVSRSHGQLTRYTGGTKIFRKTPIAP